MSFSRFPATIFPPHSRDLFHILDELSTVPSAHQNAQRRAFSPNFDVHETSHAYILEGELPGIEDKNKINIEFTDPQTLLVRGRIERSYTHEEGGETKKEGEAKKEGEGKKEKHKKEESKEVTTTAKGELKKATDTQPKFWVSERTVGEFQRSFSFPTAIDIDNVKASLQHGILKIVVPKKEEPKGKKIMIE
ncbi:hypothetical protein RUND412_002074 [Rhizina undulata]